MTSEIRRENDHQPSTSGTTVRDLKSEYGLNLSGSDDEKEKEDDEPAEEDNELFEGEDVIDDNYREKFIRTQKKTEDAGELCTKI